MDQENKQEKLKLKQIKLSEILFQDKLNPDFNIYNIKTERPNIKSRNKLLCVNNKNNFLNTLNTTYLYKRNKPKINLNCKSVNRNSNLPGINKITSNKNLTKSRPVYNIEGYNYCFSVKKNKIYEKMNKLLLDKQNNKIYKISLPKYKCKFNNELIKTTKNNNNNRYKSAKDNNLFNRLIKKEKIESRNKYNTILTSTYKKLDNCETKFNRVIARTMKLLFEYQKSFGFSKEENKNDY